MPDAARAHRPGPGRWTGPLRAVVTLGVVATVVLVVLVATLAASAGPTQVLAGDGPRPDRVSVTPPSETPSPPAEPVAGTDDGVLPTDDDGSLRWVGVVVRALLVALVVVALVLVLVLRLRRRRSRTRTRTPTVGDPDFEVVDPAVAVAAALSGGAAEQDSALAAGTPRNGIVEAWVRFEQQAERAGVPREPWETSTEFTERLLATVQADATTTTRLAGLYRLARFSDHELGEAERDAAADALRRLRAGLPRHHLREEHR